MHKPMKTSLEKLAQHFRVLSEILEGCFNLFISQRLFDSCIKNRSMVITEDFLAFFNNCLPLEFSCTWILQCALISDHFAGSGRKRKNNCSTSTSTSTILLRKACTASREGSVYISRLTTTPGSTTPTLYEQCVSSLTSHSINIGKDCETGPTAVSYTHLTLPTIYSV